MHVRIFDVCLYFERSGWSLGPQSRVKMDQNGPKRRQPLLWSMPVHYTNPPNKSLRTFISAIINTSMCGCLYVFACLCSGVRFRWLRQHPLPHPCLRFLPPAHGKVQAGTSAALSCFLASGSPALDSKNDHQRHWMHRTQGQHAHTTLCTTRTMLRTTPALLGTTSIKFCCIGTQLVE